MEMRIRQETPADFRGTEFLVREAFWNVYAPGCCEHFLLHRMREQPDFPAALSLVAEVDGRLIGHVACMPGRIEGDGGSSHEVLTLGPVAVLPSCQRRGVGAALLARCREIAAGMSWRAILLCGDPDYYGRRGFEPAEKSGIRDAENRYRDALQICGLYEGALEGLAGRYFEHPVYRVEEAACTAFDRGFPPKERCAGTPSQRRFLEIAKRCRPFAD